MKSLRFKKLWLVSETSRAARSIEFNPKMTLLVGKNHTGKSTLVKHIFKTLGCETKGKSDRWDSLAISVLRFDLDGVDYLAYRRANVFALKNESTGAIKVTTKYSEWSDTLALLFDFHLMLPTHQESLSQATPPFMFLPFYFDQDGSWQKQWNSFDKLSQFSSWTRPLISYVTGQRPNGYYIAKFKESIAKAEASKVAHELGVVQSALARVKKSLPRTTLRIDAAAFKQEIADLLRSSTQLNQDQESLRSKAFEQASVKESLSTQIAMAKDALRDLEGDLKYLTESKVEPTLLCPTCGTTHDNGFPIRLELVEDAETLRKIIAELESERQKVDETLAGIQGKLNRVRLKSREIEKTLQIKKGTLRLKDVVDSQSSEVVRSAFTKDMDSLRQQLTKHEEISADLKDKVSKFDLPERTKEINSFYAERIELFASELGVQDLREDVKKKPDANITASGSALPRSLLAYQFAVLHTAKEKGDAKLFPVVVDSPNQQGQDAEHLTQMLNFIVKRIPMGQQLILAVEERPTGLTFDGVVVELETPYGLLDTTQYETISDELKSLVSEVAEGVDARLANQRIAKAKDLLN
jgi:energy-coupling factor transporter ATP-binding protein EcfA2